ncbi:MAG: hypothetical protein JSU96_18965 [Acidobacteriota bacterium]|nr:MAG: hypothetical protein JSU96_18965 [Acidobacteriota bacterium]
MVKQVARMIPEGVTAFLPSIRWGVAALILLGSITAWTLLSGAFIYGEGHTERPIILFVASYLVAWTGYAMGLLLVRAGTVIRLRFILAVAVLARIILLPSGLIQENDVYRYVLDGQVMLHGENPYEHPPSQIREEGSPALQASLRGVVAQVALGRIGYPEIPTVYPPAAQVVYALGAMVGGWDWQGQRWVFLVIDLLVILLLLLLLRALSLPRAWILFYAWNPLILKEIANSCHVDILVGLFIVGSLVCLERFKRTSRALLLVPAGGLLGLAALSKLYPLLLLPGTLLWLGRSRVRWPVLVGFCFLVVVVFVTGFLPFLGIGLERLTAGVTTYADRWIMNEGVFALVARFIPHPRPAVTILIGILAVLIPLVRGGGTVLDLGIDYLWILLVWFLLIPTPFPWYAIPLICLGTLVASRAEGFPVALLSGSFGLYYLSFFYEYNNFVSIWWNWTRAIEHGIVWVAIVSAAAASVVKKRRRGNVDILSSQ